jgi:phosphate transport system substrate-binding protein
MQLFINILFIACLSGLTYARQSLPVVGTGDGIELLRAIADSYSIDQKKPEIQIPPSIGSGGGIGAVGSGSSVIGRVARALKTEEISRGLVYVPIARIPTVIFVNKSLRINSLSSEQVTAIYRGQIRNWKEVGGPDVKVRIVRREDGDSSLEALRKNMSGWKDLKITERTKTAISTQEAIETVRDTAGTIGFGPFSSRLKENVNVLAIDGELPTDPNYRSAVELALIYKSDTLTEEVKDFISFVKSKKSYDLIEAFGAHPVAK